MAELKFRARTKTAWVPADYTANATVEIWGVRAGDLVGPVAARVAVVFNGSGTDAVLILGDDGDTDRFVADGNIDETTTGLYLGLGGSASNYLALGHHLYTAANTIDIVFTANTAGTRTTGTVNWWAYIAQIEPSK